MVEDDFLTALASAAPTPGGGAGAAYAGALASALASMVASLTVGKAAYAAVEESTQAQAERLEKLRARLLDLVEEDARAFQPIAQAYRMPKSTPEEQRAKHEAIQRALPLACDVPLAIMEACLEVMEACGFLAQHGSRLAVSDAGAGAVVANGALQAASLNIYINAASMDDAAQAAHYRERSEQLMSEGARLADAAYNQVAAALGAPPLHETFGITADNMKAGL